MNGDAVHEEMVARGEPAVGGDFALLEFRFVFQIQIARNLIDGSRERIDRVADLQKRGVENSEFAGRLIRPELPVPGYLHLRRPHGEIRDFEQIRGGGVVLGEPFAVDVVDAEQSRLHAACRNLERLEIERADSERNRERDCENVENVAEFAFVPVHVGEAFELCGSGTDEFLHGLPVRTVHRGGSGDNTPQFLFFRIGKDVVVRNQTAFCREDRFAQFLARFPEDEECEHGLFST